MSRAVFVIFAIIPIFLGVVVSQDDYSDLDREEDAGVSAASTTVNPNCNDTIPDCSSYLEYCTNPAYIPLMEQKCPKSCGFCGSTMPCVDNSPNCASWAANGFCSSSSYTEAQKEEYCAKTCNLCGGTCQDNSNYCATWNANGFCKSTTYTNQQKHDLCAKTCGLC